MLDANISGVVVSIEDLKTAPPSVRAWILGGEDRKQDEDDRNQNGDESHRPRPSEDMAVFADPPKKKDVHKLTPQVNLAPQFSMDKFIEEARDFISANGAPAMLPLLRSCGVERVSQCTSEEAGIILEGMKSHVSTR